MIPTLKIGDFILVNKLSYGLKLPFSDFFSNPIYLSSFKSPETGDVIVFKYPNDPSINYIKRVIGVPGDEIEIINKVVFINKKAFNQKEVAGTDFMKDMDFEFKDRRFIFSEIEIGKKKNIIQTLDYQLPKDNMPSLIVPSGKYFVMGDNRDFSADSRFWGFVPAENIKGRAILVWFSAIFPFSDNPVNFRPSRIGTTI
jgi:signal peptidase I